jgi:hypothetical protein
MEDNVGKTIRICLKKCDGEPEWIERKIADLAEVRTSEQAELRYKVPMTLRCEGIEKEVLVSLNDRSQMSYPMLLGRNFLHGDFVVDVDLEAEQQ